MKRLIILVIELTALFTLCVFCTRLIGISGKQETIVAIIRDDAQFLNGIWCWKTICPDRTTIAEAREIVLRSGGKLTIDLQNELLADFMGEYKARISVVQIPGDTVDWITIGYSQTLRPVDTLADAVISFGSPKIVRLPTSAYSFGRSSVCFENHLCVYLAGFQGRFEPYLKVDDIEFQSSEADRELAYQTWKGFTYYSPR